MSEIDAYKKGFIDGLTSHAHWRDGEQLVGTMGRTLRKAIENVEETWNWSPPAPSVEDYPMEAP